MAAAMIATPEDAPGLNLAETEKYLARTLLSDNHYTKIHQALASRWDRLHSLSAAMKLMERYGVVLSPEDEQRLASLDESQQINALVMKMPQQSNEQFQQFFLQLQLLVSTATRVRYALEQGRPDQVDQALTDAESTGISQYILRMAIVQAGSEVAMLKQQYANYMREADVRCGKLIRGQEDSMQAQKRLAAAHAQLSLYRTEQNSKVKKVMMGFAAQSALGLLSGTFKGWSSYVKQTKLENEATKELKEKLETIELKLVEYKEKSLGKARGVLMKKALVNDETMRSELFRIWKDEVKEAKEKALLAGQVQELEKKLENAKSSQISSTKKVMMRMNAGNDYQLVGMVFAAFVSHHKDYAKNKEMEDKVKLAEQKFSQFKAQKSEGARKVLSSMGGSTDSGLIVQVYQAWRELWDDAKKEAEIEAVLHKEQAKLAMFSSRSKDAGMTAMERARYHTEIGFLLRILSAWKLDTRMEVTLRTYHAKIDAKRGQLVGVQHMFRRFATELETSLKGSQDTSRDLQYGPPVGRRLQKSDNTVSLPDINAKQSSGRHHKDVMSGGRGRTPVGSAYPSSRPSYTGIDNGASVPPPRGAWH